MGFNQGGDISTLKDGSLKIEDTFAYLASSILSIEKDNNTWLEKTWLAIDRLPVIRKSNQNDKIKRSFFPSSGRVGTVIWMLYIDVN